MADHTNDHTTYVERERVERGRESSGTGLAFIVGGLVVAVIVLVLLFTGGDGATDSGATNVNIEATDEAPLAPAADPQAVPPQADATPLPEAAPADGDAAPAADAN